MSLFLLHNNNKTGILSPAPAPPRRVAVKAEVIEEVKQTCSNAGSVLVLQHDKHSSKEMVLSWSENLHIAVLGTSPWSITQRT